MLPGAVMVDSSDAGMRAAVSVAVADGECGVAGCGGHRDFGGGGEWELGGGGGLDGVSRFNSLNERFKIKQQW